MKGVIQLRWVQKIIHLLLVCAMVLTPLSPIMPVAQAEPLETAPRQESVLSLQGVSSDPVSLKDFPTGSLLQFAGYNWIVLNPSTGMLIKQTPYGDPVAYDTSNPNNNVYFNPSSSSNLGYLLNTTFFNSLTALDQSRIRTVTWHIGPQGHEWEHVLDAKVGLLNELQVQTEPVASQLQSLPVNAWLSTWYAVDNEGGWGSGLSGNYYLNAGSLLTVETNYSAGHNVHPVIYLSPNTPTISGAVIPPQNEILSFSVPNQRGESVFDYDTSTITFTVTDLVNLTSIAPQITLSPGATSQPANGVTTDLSTSTTCTVTSADGFGKVWVLVAQVISTNTQITEFSVDEMQLVGEGNYASIDRERHMVHFLVPANTDITQLTPMVYAGMDATLSPLSGTPQDFTSPVTYTVTARAGNTQDWRVTCVRVGDNVPYIVEHYHQDLVGLGYTLNNTQTLSGVLGSEVTATAQTTPGFIENTSQANRIASGVTLLDGGLTLRLYYDRTLHSVTYEEDGGSNIVDLANLRYGSPLTTPPTTVKTGYQFSGWFTDAARTQAASFPMTLTGNTTFYAKWESSLGAPGDITGFSVRNQIGSSTITRYNEYSGSIDLVMPAGSDLQWIAPVITTVAGTTVSPTSGEIRDFQGSDQYGVEYTADYGGEYPVTWSVRISLAQAPLNILSFAVPGQLGDSFIDPTNHTVQFVMPSGSDVTALRPSITAPNSYAVFTGFWWGVQNYYSPTPYTAEDFSYPVEFHVVGNDSLEQSWTATCIIQSETAGYISSFTVPGQVGNSFLDMVNHKVVFHMPYGTDATNLQPTITVPAGSTLQPLAESVRDYSGLVYFNVTAPEGTPQLWTVQCIVDLNTEKNITAVTLENNKGVTIDSTQHTVTIKMPVGTDITNLAPQYQISAGAEILPVSGLTKNFSTPKQYLVYAQDGSQQLWTVSVILLGNVTVEHYQMMPAGSWYGVERANYYYDQLPGSTFTAEPASFIGFVENTTSASRIPSGTVQAGQTLTLKLYYDRLPYTVQFIENGGSEIADLTHVLYGTLPTRPTPPVKAGYRLENWYTDPELTTAYQFDVDITQNLVLYAKWEVAPPVFTPAGGMYAPGIVVTADMDCYYTTDGSDPRTDAGIFLAAGEGITLNQSSLIKSCSKYAGEFSPVQEAAYEINTAKTTVTFESNHGSVVASQEIAYGHSAVQPDPPTQYGYAFVGWYRDFSLSQPYDFASIVQEDITLYAKWTFGTYTLSFDTQGGSAIAPITAWFGSYLTEPAPPTKVGYTFKQWNPAFPEYMTMPGEDTTLVAVWTANQYTLSFNTAGGSSIADQLQTWNLAISVPANPTKIGYTFTGWSPAIPEIMPMSDLTVTAQWTVNQYSIAFDSAGGTEIPVITQDYGTAMSQPANPTKTGYTFNGWSPALPTTMPAENKTLTAQWVANPITLHFETGEGTAITDVIQDCGTTLVAPTAPTRIGYAFGGWEPALPTLVPTSNQSYVALWNINTYVLSFNPAGGSSVASITRFYNTALIAPTAPTKLGYTFLGWSPEFPSKMPAENLTLKAQWQINAYTLTFDSTGGSSVPALTQNYGSNITQPADPRKAGYSFNGWSSAVPATMPAENKTLTAQWIANAITLHFDTGEGTAIDDLVQDCGTPLVPPTAPTRTGYTFTGWNPTLPSTIPTADQTFTAQWQINQYTLSFDSQGGSSVESVVKSYNTALTAPPEPTKVGYTFNGWSPAFPTVMPATDLTLTAQWSKNSYTITFNSNGGSLVFELTVAYGDPILPPANPTKTGYDFGGWQPALPSTMPANNLEVQAYWGANLYTITFDTDGGTAIAPLSRDVETALTPPTAPTKVGYTFQSWLPEFPVVMPAFNQTLVAQWQVNQYTISFDSVGGTAVPSITQDFGSNISAPANPTKAGYTFIGWSRDLPPTMPAENLNLTASWQANAITLQFDTGEGTAIDNLVLDYGTLLTPPANPTRTGYTFAGWNPTLPNTVPTADQTYTALWSVNTYTIGFDSQGGSLVASVVETYNTALTTPTPPTKLGYSFQGWLPVLPSVMPAENLTLVAQWLVNQYTLSFNTAGGTDIASMIQDFGSEITAPQPPTRAGYSFVDWSKPIPTTMPADNKTLTALWQANRIALRFVTGEGSLVGDILQDCDTLLTPPANPTRTGYTFAGWLPTLPEKIPTTSQTYTAQWSINSYTIRFDSQGGSLVNDVTKPYNTALTSPTAPTRVGYTFNGWLPAIPTVMPAFNQTLVAQWQVNQYTLSFDTAGGSLVTALTQDFGSVVTAPLAPTKTGYTFNGWSSALPATMPAENQILVAQWQINQYTLSFDTAGGSLVTALTQDFGSAVTAPSVPTKTGYVFTGWNPNLPVTMPAEDLTLVAQWTPVLYTVTFDSQGGSAVSAISQEYLKAITQPSNPSKAGHAFTGWYTTAEATGLYDFATPMTENRTLYAGWQIQSYTVTFKNWDDTILSTESVVYNTAANPPPVPDREPTTQYFFEFTGWNSGWNDDPNQILRDAVFTAVFSSILRSYTVYYLDASGAEINTQTVAYDDWAYEPQQPYKEGQTFMGWFQEASLLNTVTFPVLIQGDLTFYASFKRPYNEIISFQVGGQVGESKIDSYDYTVSLQVPWHTSRTQLVPTITVSPGATITPASGEAVDLSYERYYTVTAEDGSQKQWLVAVYEAQSPNEIESFTVAGQNGDSIIDPVAHTVVFHMPFGSNVTALRPTVTLTYGANCNVGYYPPINYGGLAPIDFTGPVQYNVFTYSSDNQYTYSQDWLVSCIIDPNTENDFTSFAVENQVGNSEINAAEHTILFHMPYGTDATNLQPQWTLSANATVSMGASTSDFSQPVSLTVRSESWAEQVWQVTCIVDLNRANDILQFAVANQVGSSQIDAENHSIVFHMLYNTDVTAISPVILISEQASISPASATARNFVTAQTYEVTSQSLEVQNWTVTCVVDPNRETKILTLTVPGQFGQTIWDESLSTIVFHVPYGTNISQLTPTLTLSAEATVTPASGTALDFSQAQPYTVTAQGGEVQVWTVHAVVDPNRANGILSFNIDRQVGESSIDATLHTVIFHMPYGTDITTLRPTFTLSERASSEIASGALRDFTQTVTYGILSDSQELQNWTVTCVVNPNTENKILGFSIVGQSGSSVIDAVAHTITLAVPYGTQINALVPTLNVSAEATVNPGIGVAVDLRQPIVYTVTSQSGVAQTWTITCTVLPNTEKRIEQFTIPGQIGDTVIDQVNRTVRFEMPYTTTVNALTPTLTLSAEARVSPASQVAVDFSQPQTYTVTAQDGSSQTYTVTCIRRNTANEIVSFRVNGQYGSTQIDPVNHTVIFYLFPGTPVSSIAPTLESSPGATVFPVSGRAQNFSSAVVYTVTAENGTPQIWTAAYRIYYEPEEEVLPPVKPPTPPEEQPLKPQELIQKIEPLKKTFVQVSTDGASGITSKTASLSGRIVTGGGDLTVGFRYRQAGQPDWMYTGTSRQTIADGGSFSTTLTDLNPGTEYEAEARAANSFGLGEGGIVGWKTQAAVAPKVATYEVMGLNLNQATLTGAVLDDGGSAITATGFQWGLSEDSFTEVSTGLAKQLQTTITDLKPGQKLIYRAFATNAVASTYASWQSFIVPGLVVTTLKPTEITRSSATLQGLVLGASKILESGFSISPGEVSQVLAMADANGTFSTNLQNLKPDTKYYYTAYAKTAAGEFRGEIQELIPVNDFPVVETYEATDITQVLANIGGYVVKNSGYKITDSGFVWGMDPNPDQKISVTPGEDLRALQYKLVGLKGNTTYYYRAYATNEKGTGYGKTLQFVTTKALKPTVVTQSVTFDHASWQWVMVGSVTNNGGVPLVEYGFRVSSNQTEWAQLVVGFDVQGDYISRGLQFMDDLTPGEYFLRAYAMNPGGLGEGETISFKVPTKPSLTASVDTESIVLDHLTVIGNITDTGGPQIPCVSTQFKLRKAGESEWATQGFVQGQFAAGEFRFDATGLTPGAKYELMAEARNQLGWGSSSVVSFLMNYGKTDRDAVAYLKKQGKTATEIASILKLYYQDSPEAAVAALQYGEFSLSEITAAMKNSTYATNFRIMATLMKEAGYDAVALAKAMLEHYQRELQLSDSGGSPQWALLIRLKANGYTSTDLAKVCYEVYQYEVAKTVNTLRSGSLYEKNESYLASLNVYGLEPMVQFLWARAMEFIQRNGQGQMFQVLYEMTDFLRDIAKLTAEQTAGVFQKIYPSITANQLAEAFYDSKESVSEAGKAVAYLFGNNPMDIARALERAGYAEELINEYLIKELGATALEMVPIVVNIYKYWKDPKEGCAIVFKTYFNLDAIGAAKVLYAAGWTENVIDYPGYGLGSLIWTMKLHYGYTSDAQLIEVFKALGLSPLEVAKRLVANSGWRWLPSYRLGGYTATDAAVWLKSDWAKYGRRTQIIQTIKMCYEAGYEVTDIATALIFHYDLEIAESMVFFVDNTNLSSTVIKEALTKAYGKDPLQSAVEKMKGQPLEKILSTLKNTYEVKDPVEATNLLIKLGYSREAIFEKMIWTYFDSFNKRVHLESFTAYLQKVDSELNRKDAMNAFLRRNQLAEGPEYAVGFLRHSAQYSMSEIAEIFRKEYQVTVAEALTAFFSTYGAGKEVEYYPFVIKAYDMDISSYIRYQRNRGIDAIKSTKELIDIFKLTNKIEVAEILYKSNYDKEAIAQSFLQVFFSGFLSPEVIVLMDELNEKVFKQGLSAQIETLTQKGALQPVTAVISTLHAAGISLPEIIRTLKDLYAHSQKEAHDVTMATALFSYEEVSQAVQLVYGSDFVVAMIRLWRTKTWGNAEFCFRELERSSGITDRGVIFRYLRMAGFTEKEAAVALYWVAREDMLVTLKGIYNLQSAIELAQKLKQLTGELTSRFHSTTFANYLVSLYPQTTNYEIVQAFLAIGLQVPQGGGDSIAGWLRSYANMGKRDERLATYLGKNNNGLNLEVHTAVEVLQKIGYNVQDTTYYALKCGFTWSQFFKQLVYKYAPTDFPTSYYDNNSSSKFIVGDLKPYYSILDIAEGLFGYHQSSGRVLADLISAGLSVEEATYATLWQGGEAASGMVVSLVSNSIGRANAAKNQSLRLNAVQATEIVFYNSLAVAYDRKVAGLPFNDPITLEDIAKSLVRYGPGAQSGWESQYFNHWEMLAAMQNITGKYLALAKVDMPVTEIALATMRLAGLSATDAAAMMAAHKVGLSTSSIIMSVFGLGNDWFEAVKILAGSGYSFSDSISAVYNNSSYHMVIGISILSSLVTSAISKLSSIASIGTYVNYIKQTAILGFMIGRNASITDILLHLPNFYLGFAGRLAYAGGRVGYTYIPGAP